MSPTASQVAAEVDGERLMRHCAEFARRVKLSGTPEELESVRYLQRCLDESGCRTQLLFHDAYISLPGAARIEALGREVACITHAFSRNSPSEGLNAELVDLGSGGEAEFAAGDCKGKIVLVDGIASPAVAARARIAGAAGLLHVSHHAYVHEMCISPIWGNPSGATIGLVPTAVVCTIAAADGAALREALAMSALEVTLHAVVDTGWRKTPLLVADIDAVAAAEAPFVLMSGHHDTWHYGVMDNGSANATMLEVARILAARKTQLRRNIRICFWSGHSHGRYSGSTWYADLNWRDLDRRCVAHVNVDSTGGVGATVCGENGVVSALAGLARDATQAEAGQMHLGKRHSRSSDQSFWGIGIPSMYGTVSHQSAGQEKMRHALGWWWHTPEDLLDKIDRDFLVRDTRIVLHTMWRLATDPVLPIDPREQLDALARELAAITPLDADFRTPVETALVEAQAAFDALAESRPTDDIGCRKRNVALMHACRALVPVDYTHGDRFDHDAALPQNAWPVLDGFRVLAAAPSGSDAARFAMVGAIRARNRMLSALEAATTAAKASSGRLG